VRLKRVEMIGFKSFMDRTVLDFRDGITTILGPNGCGKSNVVDAVRWVLGEQSAKQLRGEKMDDVIFKGTHKRKPLSVAEVSLVFEDCGPRLGVEYDEVALTRRVTRAGTSDYFINRAPSRLKDIKDLFYDTGVGNNAYSVIEQEVVGQVLDPTENKVRTILEEGSGIVRYKVKRKEALRKLDLTERDLLRVEDIIEEIGRQVRSLARQVGKARRHQKLLGEVRGLELIRADLRIRKMDGELDGLRERADALRAEGSGDDAALARHNADLEAMRPALDGLENEGRSRAHELSQIEEVISRLEGELLVLREKIGSGERRDTEIQDEMERGSERAAGIEAEIEAAEKERDDLAASLQEQVQRVEAREREAREVAGRHDEVRRALAQAQQLSLGFLREEAEHKAEVATAESRFESLRDREASLVQSVEDNERRCGELAQERATAQARLEETRAAREARQAELERAREDVRQLQSRLEEQRETRSEVEHDLARVESRLEIASRIAKEYEGYRAGAAALLRDEATRDRLRGALAESLQVRSGYEACFEMLFGEDADALLVDDVTDARELAQRLAGDDLGRASFVVGGLIPREDSAGGDAWPGQSALDLVRAAGPAEGAMRAWLSRVRVVETTSEAVEAAVAHAGRGFSFLAREGLYIRFDGLVRGGAGARRQLSMFGRQEQVEGLQAESAELAARVAAAREREAELETGLAEGQAAVSRLEQQGAEERAAVEAAGAEVASLESVLTREREAGQQLTAQRDTAREELSTLMGRIDALKSDFGLKGVDTEGSRLRVEELSEQVHELESRREAANSALSEARVELTRQQGAERELGTRLERLGHMRDDLGQRHARLTEERATLRGNLGGWKETLTAKETQLETGFTERETRREGVRAAQAKLDAKRGEMEAIQESISAINKRQREKADALHGIETELTKHQFTVQNMRDRIQEKFQTDLERGLADLQPETLPKELVGEEGVYQLDQVEELLGERQQKLDKIGPVNFVALEEYDEKKTRLEFLEKQRDDLLSSKEDLLQAIDRINRTARKLFKETFDEVRNNFREIFTTLFQGGNADLVLHKSDDPLESEVQIVAQPTGKAVDSVALLSGGERALTAIALLFAVYLIKPSPFCLLDEVDAPLDDVNVGRFVRLLQRFAEKTQFIVITHNKLTMECADHLYGVTMEERGVSRLVSVSFDELDAEDPLQALERQSQERAESRPAARLKRGPADASDAQDYADGAVATEERRHLEGEA